MKDIGKKLFSEFENNVMSIYSENKNQLGKEKIKQSVDIFLAPLNRRFAEFELNMT